MKTRIKAIIKSSRFIYNIYFIIGSLALRFLGLFVKTDRNLLLFVSYGGQKYDDSPRVIYEYLQEHPVSDQFRYVWAFITPEEFPQIKNKVKIDTLRYYITALTAEYWITNSSAARGLSFKKHQTKNILFPHGMTGMKKIGIDIQRTDDTYHQNFQEKFDMIFVEGKQETEILSRAWKHKKSCFYTTGFPRNDELIYVSSEEVAEIKQKLNIPLDKKVILYAPTFREHSRNRDKRNVLPVPFDFDHMESLLGDNYVMLITAHYEVAMLLGGLPNNDFVYNAFKYPEINDLLKITDVLISDYSSVVFDYAILERPIFCYGYDYDTYRKDRGFYTDLETLFSHGVLRTQEELETAILTMDYERECLFTKTNIKEKYLATYGDAAKKACGFIFNDLS